MESRPLAELLVRKDTGAWGDEEPETGILVLRSTNMRNDGSLDLGKEARRSIPAAQVAEKRLEPGDILLERSGGGPRQPVGRVALYRGHTETVVHGNFVGRLRADMELVEPRYLFRYLHKFHADGGTLWYQAQTTGIHNLRFTDYLTMPIPLPPLEEQKRIADLLDEADGLQQLCKEANEKAQRILPALFIEMFGDPETNPMGWRLARVDDVCKTKAGGTPRRGTSRFYGGDIPWVKIGDFGAQGAVIGSTEECITGEGLQAIGNKMHAAGTPLLAMYGASIGRVGVAGTDCASNQAVLGVTPVDDQVLRHEFVLMWLCLVSTSLVGMGAGGAQPNISATIVRRLEIPIPPIQLQSKFAILLQDTQDWRRHQSVASERRHRLGNVLRSRLFALT